METARHRKPRDRGSILILVLVLTVFLAVIATALANYAAVGLKTSDVSTERTDKLTAATAAVYVVIERDLAANPLSCPSSSTVPATAIPNRTAVSVTCQLVSGGDPSTYRLTATAVGAPTGRVQATVEVRTSGTAPRAVRVVEWSPN